jgi:hypothetical protein
MGRLSFKKLISSKYFLIYYWLNVWVLNRTVVYLYDPPQKFRSWGSAAHQELLEVPLGEFIEETIKVLGTDVREVLVERAKPFRNSQRKIQ